MQLTLQHFSCRLLSHSLAPVHVKQLVHSHYHSRTPLHGHQVPGSVTWHFGWQDWEREFYRHSLQRQQKSSSMRFIYHCNCRHNHPYRCHCHHHHHHHTTTTATTTVAATTTTYNTTATVTITTATTTATATTATYYHRNDHVHQHHCLDHALPPLHNCHEPRR
jgi:hypothetical protein